MDLSCSRMAAACRPAPPRRLAMSPDRLIYMANQIGKFFQSQGPDKVVAGPAEHIRRFCDPRMARAMSSPPAAGGAGLDAQVRAAIAAPKRATSLPPAS